MFLPSLKESEQILRQHFNCLEEDPEDYFYYSHIIEDGFHFWIKYELRDDKMFVLDEGRKSTDKVDREYIEKVKKDGKSQE